MSKFRAWVYQVWQDNCTERDAFHELPYSQQEYWARYKYWLKREFRFQNQRLSKP